MPIYNPPLSFKTEPEDSYIIESYSLKNRLLDNNNIDTQNTTSIVLDCSVNAKSHAHLSTKWFKDNVDLNVQQYSSEFKKDFEK